MKITTLFLRERLPGGGDEMPAKDYPMRPTMVGVWVTSGASRSYLVPWSVVRAVEFDGIGDPPEWCGLVEPVEPPREQRGNQKR